jgi:hypothetical protein
MADLMEVFLGLTRGFDMLTGAVVLLSSPSFAATIGAAEYSTEFVWSSGQLRNAFIGGVTVLQGIPFLLGGTSSRPAVRTLAPIEHWIRLTLYGTDDISATRTALTATLRTKTSIRSGQHIIRLRLPVPVLQSSMEKATFITARLDILKMPVRRTRSLFLSSYSKQPLPLEPVHRHRLQQVYGGGRIQREHHGLDGPGAHRCWPPVEYCKASQPGAVEGHQPNTPQGW